MYMTMMSSMPTPMPIGTFLCGFLVSSEAVATTSKPRKAKNTSAAPERMPGTPYTDGVMPVANCHSGWVIKPVTAEEPSTVEAGWLGGMNGVKLEALT